MQSGGSTKPWRVVAIPENVELPEELPYVVKLFTENNIKQGHSIAKEFICNYLAGQFDFDVPEACLINLHDENFVATLDEPILKNLLSKHQGVTYSSQLSNATLVNEQLKGTFSMQNCASLFAFDCLIFNVDRGGHHNKPNLLTDDDGFILIDHELTFNFIDDEDANAYAKVLDHFNENTWPNVYQNHLFFNLLKSYRGSKKNLFDTFEESLRVLNINDVQSHIDELENNDIAVGASDLLISYLRHLKQNSNKFRNILLGLIS
jgi:hypothetical protein